MRETASAGIRNRARGAAVGQEVTDVGDDEEQRHDPTDDRLGKVRPREDDEAAGCSEQHRRGDEDAARADEDLEGAVAARGTPTPRIPRACASLKAGL